MNRLKNEIIHKLRSVNKPEKIVLEIVRKIEQLECKYAINKIHRYLHN